MKMMPQFPQMGGPLPGQGPQSGIPWRPFAGQGMNPTWQPSGGGGAPPTYGAPDFSPGSGGQDTAFPQMGMAQGAPQFLGGPSRRPMPGLGGYRAMALGRGMMR